MNVNYVYSKKRREFGRPCMFIDAPPQILVDVQPDDSLQKNYILRETMERSTQYSNIISEHEVNTVRYDSEQRGINHTEGGWPKDINIADVEQTTRFRKKIEKDDNYMTTVVQLGNIMEHCIRQNNAINIYEKYFADISGNESDDLPTAKSVNVFKDPNKITRTASTISWSPTSGTHIAVAYCNQEFQGMNNETCIDSYVWDVENPYKPDFVLKPPSALLCLEYNAKEPSILTGGTCNGQVAFWDLRKGSQPTDVTPMEKSHRDPVYKVLWNHSKTGTECFSSGTDGQVFWWDMRKLNEPMEMVILDPNRGQEPQIERAQGATVLEYEPTIPTKFLVGTESGTVIACNKKAKAAHEKVIAVYAAHLGPVYALQRNPFFPKNFLTVGDWSAKVWSEDVKESCIIWTKWDNSYMTDACWSPVRPSAFFTVTSSGLLQAWDILVKHGTPVFTMQVVDESLNSLRSHDQGIILACGSHSGKVTLVEVSSSLTSLHRNDKNLVTEMFEREARREKILEARNRELRLKGKTEAKGSTIIKQEAIKGDDFNVDEIEAEFQSLVS